MALSFDATYYMTARPDVLNAYVNAGAESGTGQNWAQFAEQHYNTFGWKEGYNPNTTFDTTDYLAANLDVLEAGVNPFTHYLQFGANEGRAPSATFPPFATFGWEAYLAANPDLAAAGITTDKEAYGHFVIFGQFEGRPGAPVVDTGIPGATFTLTTDVQSLVGTANNDTFIAGVNGANQGTLNPGDAIDGGAGVDTLNIFGNANAGRFAGANITNVENVSAQFSATGGTLNVSANADVQQATVAAGSIGNNTVTLTKAQTGGLEGNVGGTATFAFSNATAATNDVANLSVNGAVATGVTIDNTNTVETLNINATGANALGTLTAAAATTLNITGSGSVSAVATAAALKTVDASANTGGVTLTLAGAGVDLAVKGSSANDTLTTVFANLSAADVIDLGAGDNDTLLFTGAASFATAPDAAKLSKVTNVEELGTVAGVLTVDGDLVSQTHFSTSGAAGGFAVTDAAQGTTLEFGAGGAAASTAAMKLGANTLDVALQGGAAAADVTAGLTVTGSATINVSSSGRAGVADNVLVVTAADNQLINLTGSQNTTLTVNNAPGTTGVSIDASSFTGKANITATADADIVKGGSGDDIINGGDGADVMTGNGGADQFVIITTAATADAAGFSAAADTVTDFLSGTDKLDFNGVAGSAANYAEATSAAASFAALLTAADAALDGTVLYYAGQIGSDTYVFYDADGTLDVANTEVVKLAGVTLDGIAFTDIIA